MVKCVNNYRIMHFWKEGCTVMCNCWSGREVVSIGQVTLGLLCSAGTEWESLMFLQFLQALSSTSQCLSRPGEPLLPLQVFESRSDAVQPYHPPSLGSICFPVCSLFLWCVMQFLSPVILYLKTCPLQEHSGTAVHYRLLNYVVLLGTCPGWCKTSAVWYCSLFSGFFDLTKPLMLILCFLTVPALYCNPQNRMMMGWRSWMSL